MLLVKLLLLLLVQELKFQVGWWELATAAWGYTAGLRHVL